MWYWTYLGSQKTFPNKRCLRKQEELLVSRLLFSCTISLINSFSVVFNCALIHPTNAEHLLSQAEPSLTFSANPQTWINQTCFCLKPWQQGKLWKSACQSYIAFLLCGSDVFPPTPIPHLSPTLEPTNPSLLPYSQEMPLLSTSEGKKKRSVGVNSFSSFY